MMQRKKKEAWSEANQKDPKAKDSSSAPLALQDASPAAIAIPDSASTNNVKSASSPALKSAQEYAFMCRGDGPLSSTVTRCSIGWSTGAFFVTSTDNGNETATVKVCLSKNMDFLVWKSHTERKEYSISLANVVNIDQQAVLRGNILR